MFYRWGSFIYKWRWLVLISSLVFLVVSPVLIAQGLQLSDSNSTNIGSDSEKGSRLIDQETPKSSGSSFSLIFESNDLNVNNPQLRNSLLKAIQPLQENTHVKSIETPYNQQNPNLISTNGREALATVNLYDSPLDARNNFQDLRNLVQSNQLKIYSTGEPAINHDFDTHLESGLQKAEIISLPIVLIC
jgi:uncharacterized membrane protein YdfJ with MMPL/SSD domain